MAKKSGSGLIAMAAHSVPAHFSFLGSVARSVIRDSEVPVWIIRAETDQQTDQKVA
jgi:nucleotide-binding universal stress UspA family protein